MPNHPVRTIWQARADALLQAFAAVMNWARETTGFAPTEADIAEMLSLRSIALIAQERLLPIPHGGQGCFLDLAGIPDALVLPLRAYLGETGGYDLGLPWDRQRSDQPYKLHSYTLLSLGEVRPGCPA